MSSYPPSQPLREPGARSHSAAPSPVTNRPSLGGQGDLDLLSLLTLQIARGHPLEAVALIDRLLARGNGRCELATDTDLRVLRNVAELEFARQLNSRQCEGSDTSASTGGTIAIILEFVDRILPAVRQTAALSRHSSLTEHIHSDWRRYDRPTSAKQRVLSDREFDVLHLVAIGMSNRKIAQTLYISEGTVKKHISNALIKLGAENRTEAVAIARRRGVLE